MGENNGGGRERWVRMITGGGGERWVRIMAGGGGGENNGRGEQWVGNSLYFDTNDKTFIIKYSPALTKKRYTRWVYRPQFFNIFLVMIST